MAKQLWILAGGNGAGKTHFFRTRLQSKEIFFINADQIGKEKFTKKGKTDAKKATLEAQKQVNGLLEKGETLCYETVFSHESKIDIVAKAKSLGYEINLVFIHLAFPELHEARVYTRVKEGEHNVPRDKIYSRLPRTMKNIKIAITLADNVLLLDNSSSENPYREVMFIQKDNIVRQESPLPDWAKELTE